jgi:hypothetical protein
MTANKWGLVATILALVGLGFAAMSTNPPFTINPWVPTAFFIAAGLTVLWLIILLVRKHSIVKIEVEKPPVLKIGARVNKIITLNYSTAMSGSEGNFIYLSEGDKIIHVDVILSPSKPMTLAILSLDVWGKRFDVLNMPTNILKTSDNYNLGFNIPQSLASTTKEARIYALANNSEWFSEPFLIDFGVSK